MQFLKLTGYSSALCCGDSRWCQIKFELIFFHCLALVHVQFLQHQRTSQRHSVNTATWQSFVFGNCAFGTHCSLLHWASGEPHWVHGEVIGWYISVGVIEGKKQHLYDLRRGWKEKLVILTQASYSSLPKNDDLKSQSILLTELVFVNLHFNSCSRYDKQRISV